ncbi:MAG: LD-carboxypeptidase [Bacteroidota bacterium]
MNRRYFKRSLLTAMGLATLAPLQSLAAKRPRFDRKRSPRLLKPKALKPGDTVGLVAPGSAATEEQFQKSLSQLQSLGLQVRYTDNILARRGYLAGEDQQRLDDLHQFFADSSIQGIWCMRGGYGSARLLDRIDYKLIRKNPKVLIGYSDITALLQAIHIKTGLVGFHGPVAVSDFNEYTVQQLNALLMSPQRPYRLPYPEDQGREEVYTIRSGKARGRLIGGNLSLLTALVGTPYQWKVKGKILFIEDVGEKPYRIDRMLTQLLQSAPLEKAAGIALGVFANCEAKPGDSSLRLSETLQDRLAQLGIPVVYGLPFGHISQQCTLPLGIEAELDADTGQLTLLETAVK